MRRFDLTGKTALVTGGSRGIGLGIALGMAEAGANVALVARGEAALRTAREQIEALGTSVTTHSFDMANAEGIRDLYARIEEQHGAVDILVNNAGCTRRGPATDMSLEDWQLVLNVNLTSVFAMSQAFGRSCIEAGRQGRIINIASLLSEGARAENAPYASSKGGIRQLTKALAIEWAPYGINVNGIGPGYVKTPLTEPLWTDEAFDAWVHERTPLKRWGTPDDLAGAAVFLASDAAAFITGQILYVDGGWLASL